VAAGVVFSRPGIRARRSTAKHRSEDKPGLAHLAQRGEHGMVRLVACLLPAMRADRLRKPGILGG